ncbi:ribosome small subunit-dependent GTPase A [Povalibacter sp.]|uniref:ribosome small subunit-dependent GTPase A n=1 Tax=Povalibacter sp. TaxID=1962978 RepID=UPI002F421ECD
MSHSYSVTQLGWSALFSQQLALEDLQAAHPARVVAVHRSHVDVLGENDAANVVIPPHLFVPEGQVPLTVGDWVLIENVAPRVLKVLERRSLIARMAAGIEQRRQLIAANVDTLLIVTSCNQDFNLSRLERYLAVAPEGRVEPVVVLTKADLCANSGEFVAAARSISGSAQVIALDATSGDDVPCLEPWLTSGQTLALAGSSGVGKSTLTNTLLGAGEQVTQSIREDDGRGRHTTTSRQLFRLPGAAWVIDTPGMRELKVGSIDAGLRATYLDIEQLAEQCRFRDCDHLNAAGCAILAAVDAGTLDRRRLDNYRKLQRESERASRTLREQRELERRWGRLHRNAQRVRRKDRGRS